MFPPTHLGNNSTKTKPVPIYSCTYFPSVQWKSNPTCITLMHIQQLKCHCYINNCYFHVFPTVGLLQPKAPKHAESTPRLIVWTDN